MNNTDRQNNPRSLWRMFYALGAPIVHELPFFIITSSYFFLLDTFTSILYKVSHNMPVIDGALAETLGMSMFFSYVVTVLAYITKNKYIKYSIYGSVFLLMLIDFFLIANVKARIGAEAIRLVAETNQREAGEFFITYLTRPESYRAYIKVVIFLITFIGLQCIKIFKKREVSRRLKTISSVVASIMILYGVICMCIHSYMFTLNTTELMMSFTEGTRFTDPISRLIVAGKTLSVSGNEVNKAIEANKAVTDIKSTDDTPLNIIVVVGESFIKWHSPMYGYPLNTTPHMLEEASHGNLFAFDNVTAPASQTSLVIKNIFSCNSISHNEMWYDHPMITSVFKQAGWNVYLWDNQRDYMQGSMWTFALNSFLYAPEVMKVAYTDTNNQSYDYDGQLIDSFKHDMSHNRNFVIFHLMGQHAKAKERYPEGTQFEHFTADSIRRTDAYLDKVKKTIIAEYDNATLYNDYVVSKVFDMCRNSNSIVIYFSDHGEEVYDYRDQYCRNLSNDMNEDFIKYMFHVPFFVWVSPKFKEQNPDIVNAIEQAKNKKFETDNLCQMLFSIGHISTNEYKPDRDVLNPDYKQTHRYAYKASILYPID